MIDGANVKYNVGYDAHASYLSAIGGNMPKGPLTHFVWNQQQNCLVGEKHKPQHAETHYFGSMAKQHHNNNSSCSVCIRLTNKHHQVETFNPDANCVQCKIVWEFTGCYHYAFDYISLVGFGKCVFTLSDANYSNVALRFHFVIVFAARFMEKHTR